MTRLVPGTIGEFRAVVSVTVFTVAAEFWAVVLVTAMLEGKSEQVAY